MDNYRVSQTRNSIPNLAKLTIEHFRNGPRWQSRLAMLAEHFAKQYNANPEKVYQDALAMTFDNEVREG